LAEQWEYPVARVIAQHRNRLDLLGEAGERGLDLNRFERYLNLANEVGAAPVIILSKADLSDDPETFCRQVQALDSLLMVVTI